MNDPLAQASAGAQLVGDEAGGGRAGSRYGPVRAASGKSFEGAGARLVPSLVMPLETR